MIGKAGIGWYRKIPDSIRNHFDIYCSNCNHILVMDSQE